MDSPPVFHSRNLLGVSDCDPALTGGQCEAVVYSRTTFAIFALFGCFLIIGTIWLFKTYHNFGQRLILYLTIAAMIDTIPYFMGHQKNSGGCTFQAFTMTWFDWSVLLWICCITHKLSVNVLHRLPGEQYEITYHLIGWVLPFIIALIPLCMGAYGSAGVWCWIEDGRSDTTALRFGIWYGPLFVLILGLFIVNGYVFSKVHSEAKRWTGTYNPEIQAEKEFLTKQVQPLKYYPVVYLLLAIFPLINRIQNAANPNNPVFILMLLHSMSSPLQSFLNAFVYMANTDKSILSQCNSSGIKRAIKFRSAGAVTEFPVGGQVQLLSKNGRKLHEVLGTPSNDSDDTDEDDSSEIGRHISGLSVEYNSTV